MKRHTKNYVFLETATGIEGEVNSKKPTIANKKKWGENISQIISTPLHFKTEKGCMIKNITNFWLKHTLPTLEPTNKTDGTHRYHT